MKAFQVSSSTSHTVETYGCLQVSVFEAQVKGSLRTDESGIHKLPSQHTLCVHFFGMFLLQFTVKIVNVHLFVCYQIQPGRDQQSH